ncbi:MAG: alkaline phosphatase family protein [Opitutae bacterium]|nr:alkaline phosphatase family protein [Opitutae bacterium]
MSRRLIVLALLLGGLLASCSTPPPPAAAQLVILISLDGFRWDYLQRYSAPTLQRLAREGVHARAMTPSYPTKTFPNHYTLVTGLRPARHGIVGNWFYDPANGETFGMSKPASNTDAKWWGGEPVWITAERQGVRSVCYFWPGSEAAHNGLRPSRWLPFNDKVPSNDRVDGLLSWLDVPAAERPRLATLYFSAVDHGGHKYGPDAPEVQASITEVDEAIARLLDGLDRLGLRASANLIILADHGMSPASTDRVIFLDDLVDVSTIEIETTGPYAGVRPKPGTRTAAELAAALRAKAPPRLQVYLRDEIPARLHYSGNDRIPAVMLIADDQWSVEQRAGWPVRAATFSKGDHGWDNATPNMGALFLAHGPAFKTRTTIDRVDNIHVYNLVCAVLGLAPAPNDGDGTLVRAALRR